MQLGVSHLQHEKVDLFIHVVLSTAVQLDGINFWFIITALALRVARCGPSGRSSVWMVESYGDGVVRWILAGVDVVGEVCSTLANVSCQSVPIDQVLVNVERDAMIVLVVKGDHVIDAIFLNSFQHRGECAWFAPNVLLDLAAIISGSLDEDAFREI